MEHELEIDVSTVAQLQKDGEDFLLLDCREPNEHAYCKIDHDQSLLIPHKQTINRLDELDDFKEKRIVVY